MAEEQVTKFPEYVTDGSHIYLWHPEYEGMLRDGRLRASDPPKPQVVKKLNQREQTKVEALRKKALEEAENAVKILTAQAPKSDTTNLFGAEPQ